MVPWLVWPRDWQRSGSEAMGRLPDWAKWAITAACVLLSPVLAFLLALAVEIVLGALHDAGVLRFVSFAAVGAVGWSWSRKLWVRAHGRAGVET